MTQDSSTLYKLIVLYMLNRVTFPLTKAQVYDFILMKEYTNFITLQQAISELDDAGLITAKSMRNRTHLLITEAGKETLHYFGSRVNETIRKDIDTYLRENELELREEVSIQSNYYRSTVGDYTAELTAREKGNELVYIRLSVPFEEMASTICDNWQKENREIYKLLTEHLF